MTLTVEVYVYPQDLRGASGKATGNVTWFDHPYHIETIIGGRPVINKKM